MIYDPQLVALDEARQPHNLAVHSALAHPDVPMLLAWPSQTPPDVGTLRAIHAAAPWVQVASGRPDVFKKQIQDLLISASVAIT